MTEVNPEMRKAWFYSEGWYADDKTILKWYNDNKQKKERNKDGRK